MSKKTFTVPEDHIYDFSEQLVELELDNEITGVTDDNEILVTVSYTEEERRNVAELTLWCEETFGDESDDVDEE